MGLCSVSSQVTERTNTSERMLVPSNTTKHASTPRRTMLASHLPQNLCFLLPFCPNSLKHISHMTPLDHWKTHKPFKPFLCWVGLWTTLRQGSCPRLQGQSEVELVPKPAQHSFFPYPALLTIKTKMMQVAAEFKVGEALLVLDDANLDWNGNVWVLGRKQRMCNHRHYLDGVSETARPEPGTSKQFYELSAWGSEGLFATRFLCIETRSGLGRERKVNALCVWNEGEVMKTTRKLK